MFKFIKVLLLLFCLCLTHNTEAHFEKSILKVNGEYTVQLPNPHSADGQEIPSTLTRTLVQGQRASFELDTSRFDTPQSIVQKTTFIWDFGDGSVKTTGLLLTKQVHTYRKQGTYTIKIIADYSTAGVVIPPQLIATADVTVRFETPLEPPASTNPETVLSNPVHATQ
jgi:hypothetical protein